MILIKLTIIELIERKKTCLWRPPLQIRKSKSPLNLPEAPPPPQQGLTHTIFCLHTIFKSLCLVFTVHGKEILH